MDKFRDIVGTKLPLFPAPRKLAVQDSHSSKLLPRNLLRNKILDAILSGSPCEIHGHSRAISVVG
jgi:hypothetical protein